jgi:hypothetical protein
MCNQSGEYQVANAVKLFFSHYFFWTVVLVAGYNIQRSMPSATRAIRLQPRPPFLSFFCPNFGRPHFYVKRATVPLFRARPRGLSGDMVEVIKLLFFSGTNI